MACGVGVFLGTPFHRQNARLASPACFDEYNLLETDKLELVKWPGGLREVRLRATELFPARFTATFPTCEGRASSLGKNCD